MNPARRALALGAVMVNDITALQGDPAMAEVHDASRTRDRVRRAVGEQAPVTARVLAKDLGLTPAAVRRHLDALEDAGLIAEHDGPLPGPRGRGRPAPGRAGTVWRRRSGPPSGRGRGAGASGRQP